MKINKTEIISIRCTVKEKQDVLLSAQKFNLSLSAYLLNRQRAKLYSRHLIKMIDDVARNDNKLENNINQIARSLNSNNLIVDNHFIEILLGRLYECGEKREQLMRKLEKIIKIIAQD